ncbi:hypothetical protein [Paenibacillus sp. NPDC058177]|uniref:hypothetical protein n=1 Tax=Paenibacillus sp. NPDC058177 TaxID=3346369 RepID=UPI0036DC242E
MVTLSAVLANALASVGMWLFVASLTEAVTEIIKNVFPVKDKTTYGVSIGIGVALALAFGLNPFGLTGLSAYASMVTAGILASRGANYLNGLLKKFDILKST